VVICLIIYFVLISIDLLQSRKNHLDIKLNLIFAKKNNSDLLFVKNKRQGKLGETTTFFIFLKKVLTTFLKNLASRFYLDCFFVSLVWKLYDLVKDFILFTFQTPKFEEGEKIVGKQWRIKKIIENYILIVKKDSCQLISFDIGSSIEVFLNLHLTWKKVYRGWEINFSTVWLCVFRHVWVFWVDKLLFLRI
jgi:hypothetical protein